MYKFLLDLDEIMKDWEEVEKTHSWIYGTWDVTCMLCRCRKGSPEARQPCRAFG